MSSGNPFRTSLALNQAPPSRASVITSEAHRPEAGTQDDDVPAHVVSPPPRTKKHVRIESTTISIPPQPDVSSPDDSPRTHFAPQPAAVHWASVSQPSSSSAYANSSPSPGAYTREPGRSHEMASPDSMGSSNAASGRSYPALSPSVVPANPFVKTLASMEPSRAGGEDREGATQGSSKGSSSSNNSSANNNRASLDVESFKNMLLTGRPYPRQVAQAPLPRTSSNSANAAVVESGSSTDASSISRQSLLEPAQEASAESPRTSYEMARSDEDIVAGFTPERSRSKRKPPPAPASRHGKLVSPRQPQTVSFDSFSATETAPSHVTRSRKTSETSKPLPPTPVPSSQSPHIDASVKTRQSTSPLAENIEEPLSRSNSRQKRAPPPVPLARRQSQLRHSSAEQRSRSSSSLTLSSHHSSELPLTAIPTPGEIASNVTTTASAKAPPPPPPSRYGARLSDVGASSANSSSTELPQRSTSVRTTNSSHGPSSRRSTLEGEPELPSSRTSSKRNSRILSTENHHTSMPPPPPPPRRRPGSGRSSLDQPRPSLAALATPSPPSSRRTSTDLRRTSLDHNRRASGASEHSLRHEYAPADEEGGSDYPLYSPREEAEDKLAEGGVDERKDSNKILEDMERFQREIDELRNRYKQAG